MKINEIKKVGYCYIDDVIKEEFNPEKYNFEKDNYDPDGKSRALYEDMATIFCGAVNGNEIEINPDETGLKLEMVVNGGEKRFICSTDYIGPSCRWAYNTIGLTDKEIGYSLLFGRVLGGHMLWPTENSINKGRGGKPLYDRIDLCLKVIREEWYAAPGTKVSKYSDKLLKQIDANGAWFDVFGKGLNGFKSFIDFFRLRDFVTDEYEVISLAISDIEAGNFLTVDEENGLIYEHKISAADNCYLPGRQFKLQLSEEETKCRYKKFMQNNLELIAIRDERVHNLRG